MPRAVGLPVATLLATEVQPPSLASIYTTPREPLLISSAPPPSSPISRLPNHPRPLCVSPQPPWLPGWSSGDALRPSVSRVTSHLAHSINLPTCQTVVPKSIAGRQSIAALQKTQRVQCCKCALSPPSQFVPARFLPTPASAELPQPARCRAVLPTVRPISALRSAFLEWPGA